MCWRIVRVAGDGSIKLVLYNYSSSSCTTTGNSNAFARHTGTTYITVFNSNRNRNAYIGFMYGVPGSDNYKDEQANSFKSLILANLEAWYNLNNKFGDYEHLLADTIWCNDKSMSTESTYLGFGTNETYYKAYQRLRTVEEEIPSLICPNDSLGGSLSKFTADDEEIGNGRLEKRIGLLTVDELAFAGGIWNTANTNYYLNKNATDTNWWSLSPYLFNGNYAYVWHVNTNGGLTNYRVDYTGGLRPAISLVSTITISDGKGTASNPYVVQI